MELRNRARTNWFQKLQSVITPVKCFVFDFRLMVSLLLLAVAMERLEFLMLKLVHWHTIYKVDQMLLCLQLRSDFVL